MPFYFQHDGHKVNLEDLPLDRWITIEKECDEPWPEILSGKVIGDSLVAKAVIGQACEHLGIPTPQLTLRNVVDMITFERDESVPEQFNDGIPDPKAQASEPATT